MRCFELAGGSMIGRDHRQTSRNNQDSWSVWEYDDMTIGIVTDGCGSGTHSEIGAQLGCQMLGAFLRSMYLQRSEVDLYQAETEMLARLGSLDGDCSHSPKGGLWVLNHLLFTVVGFALTNREATFFACGDGLIVVNGEQMPLGPFPGNMPPYLAYRLVGDDLAIRRDWLSLGVVKTIPIEHLESFMVATDGINDFVAHEHSMMPGLERQVGPLAQFWQDDRYYRGNPELVSRQLKLVGRDWPVMQPNPGLLGDDTTLVVGRRVSAPKEE